MNVHRIAFAVERIAAVRQARNIREQHRRAVTPVFRVAVPEKLRAMSGAQLHHLRAERIDVQFVF